jgi:hypothetical protein
MQKQKLRLIEIRKLERQTGICDRLSYRSPSVRRSRILRSSILSSAIAAARLLASFAADRSAL